MKALRHACLLIGALLAAGVPGVSRGAQESPVGAAYDIVLEVPPDQRKLLENHLDLYRWRDGARMTEVQVQRLVRQAPEQIRQFLATEGFFSPRVEASLEQAGDKRTVRLLAEPGEPVRVANIDLRVNGPFADDSADNRERLERMRADWRLRPGIVFRQDDWEAAKREAVKALLLDRYPSATIAESQATVDPASKRVDLRVVLDSGPAYSLAELKISGLKRYPASIIERLNPIRGGASYNQAQLLELQSRLQDSPYFASASVTVDTDPAHPLETPVHVEVVENPSRRLGFGIGVSTDTGLRGQIDYRDINFLDRAWRLGGALKLDQKRQSFSGDLQFPRSEAGHLDSITAKTEHAEVAGETTRTQALGFKRSLAHGGTEASFGLRYLTENQTAGTIASRQAALSPFYAVKLRHVDQLLYPTRGYLAEMQADVASRAILSDQDFLRGHLRAIYFLPLGEDSQLILRGELGAVAARSRDGIPSEFLFRAGGDQTVRGYAYQSLGVAQGGAVVGGRYLAVASAELVHWLTPTWGGAAFIDAGNAGDSRHDLNPVYGYGAGVRWRSPVGPLSVDVAYGQEVRKWRLHFSVGFSF